MWTQTGAETPSSRSFAKEERSRPENWRNAFRLRGRQSMPYQPTSDLEELLLARIREHIGLYLTPALLGQAAVDEQAKQRQKELRRERERVEAEIQRRRKAMQELYLDKSGGCISAAQFNELNREFLDQVEQLEKQRSTLDQKLGGTGRLGGAKKEAGTMSGGCGSGIPAESGAGLPAGREGGGVSA